jgi:site-specific recombinase XerD
MVKSAQRSKTVKVDLDHARLWVQRLKRGWDVEHPIPGSLANHGYDLRLIQDYLGHRDPKHTVHYTGAAAGRFERLWR